MVHHMDLRRNACRRIAYLLAASTIAGAPLGAQCPNGSAPPCATPAPRTPPANSIAVLPFGSRSPDTADV
jgi:hypothetical protein